MTMTTILFLLTLLLGLFQVTAKRGVGRPRQRGDGARSFFVEYLDPDDLDLFKSLGSGNISAGIRLCAKIAKSTMLLVCPAHSGQVSRVTYADLYALGGYATCEVCGSRLIDRAALEVIDARVGTVVSARQDVLDAPLLDAPDAPQDARNSQDARELVKSQDARVNSKTKGAKKMKAYMTSWKNVPIKASPDEGHWNTEYFADPQDALNYLVKHGVDTAAEKTPDEVRVYTTHGSTMQVISSLKQGIVLSDNGAPDYHVLGDIKVVEIH